MRVKIAVLALVLSMEALSAGAANARDHAAARPAWVQFNADGVAEVRVVAVGAACPAIVVDGVTTPMQERAGVDANFAITLCSATLPPGAKRVSSKGRRLPVASAAPRRILVLGDTGCRIKGTTVQACNDPMKWPFPRIAKAAGALKPDLVIHVGDYLYRESACPPKTAGCAGTPWGDNWPTWQADFFTPAAPLLAAAPWVFVRGNHEDCARAGPGWLRLLGPASFDAAAPCTVHFAPFEIALTAMSLLVMDDAGAPDTSVDNAVVSTYAHEFAALAATSDRPTWLLLHRPIWGVVSGPLGIAIGGNQTLIAALNGSAVPKSVTLMLSGHIHSFEALNYTAKAPPQILAGNGGDTLDQTPRDLAGAVFQGQSGITVKDGISRPGFGFMLMTQTPQGWRLDLYRADGRKDGHCMFANARVDCPAPPHAH